MHRTNPPLLTLARLLNLTLRDAPSKPGFPVESIHGLRKWLTSHCISWTFNDLAWKIRAQQVLLLRNKNS
jgi:hypothetical protein